MTIPKKIEVEYSVYQEFDIEKLTGERFSEVNGFYVKYNVLHVIFTDWSTKSYEPEIPVGEDFDFKYPTNIVNL